MTNRISLRLTVVASISVALLVSISSISAFQPICHHGGRSYSRRGTAATKDARHAIRTTRLFMAKSNKKRGGKPKGFGEGSSTTSSRKKDETTSGTTEKNASFTPVATKPEPKPQSPLQASPPPTDPVLEPKRTSTSTTSHNNGGDNMEMGKRALEQMRREQAEKKDAELRRVKAMVETDKLLQESPEAAAIPEKVAMRMGRRMLPFVGLPLFGSLGAFVVFWYLATYKNVEFEPAMVATTTIVILVSGLLGITYSIVSASWDEDREGSFLGVEEFQKNVGNIKEGLDRSKENAILRDKMRGMPEAEIQAAIADLEKREKRQQSFNSKLGNELET